MKVRYKRLLLSEDENVPSGSEQPIEQTEEPPLVSPNGPLQESEEEMVSVVHASQVKVEPVVDSEYKNTLEGFERMTGLKVGHNETDKPSEKPKHKGSKHKHRHHHREKKYAESEDEDGKKTSGTLTKY